MADPLAWLTASAIVPDQLLPYARAISGLEATIINGCPLHHGGGQGVLVAFSETQSSADWLEETARLAAQFPGLERLTVLASARPKSAPESAACHEDCYWKLDLPIAQPKGKLGSLLRRAARDLDITQASGAGAWTAEHEALASNFCGLKQLDEGGRHLYGRLGAYLGGAPEAVLFSARERSGTLAACAIADYSALACAFYMFAMRQPSATPGAADLLLWEIIKAAERRGHSLINLGLEINSGVGFFKRKWGAAKLLPYVETSWEPPQPPSAPGKSWWRRLFG